MTSGEEREIGVNDSVWRGRIGCFGRSGFVRRLCGSGQRDQYDVGADRGREAWALKKCRMRRLTTQRWCRRAGTGTPRLSMGSHCIREAKALVFRGRWPRLTDIDYDLVRFLV